MKKLVMLLALVVVLGLAGPGWCGFDEAEAAYKGGDYKFALREFDALANQGHALAQYNLGIMYGNGQGCVKITSRLCNGSEKLLIRDMRMLNIIWASVTSMAWGCVKITSKQ